MEKIQEQTEQESERLPYEKPAVVAEEVFETLALSCARGTGDASCQITNPSNS